MRRIANKKVAAVAGTAVLVLGVGTAYAYWTTSGSGSGSATTGTSEAVTVTQDSDLTGYILGETRDVEVTVSNPADFSQNVGNVTVTVAASGVDGADADTEPDCAASNWAVVDSSDNIGTIAANGDSGSVKVATLQLMDLATNQDACKNVAPALTYAVAQGS